MKALRKLRFLGILLIISMLIIAGCSKRSANDPKDDPVIGTGEDNTGGSFDFGTGDGHGFDKFDLEIDFDEHDQIKIHYDVTEQVEADFKNTFENFDLEGKEAMDKIHEYFSHLLLTSGMLEEEVIRKTLQFFNLKDYSKFELDIDFAEGSELQIRDAK